MLLLYQNLQVPDNNRNSDMVTEFTLKTIINTTKCRGRVSVLSGILRNYCIAMFSRDVYIYIQYIHVFC